MKRGSALLIVLGMLSFMVISAVAFSAWMRAMRLPSSYLRRTSASRHLAKAALAEAIDILDIAIGNDPFPGQGDNGRSYSAPRTSTADQAACAARRNYWRSNVFIGTNRLVNADETVSTLTFEGLAYLPPALINEARYYSRLSSAARWHDFPFDSGRFAFAAVDVSDHFDVNRITANVGRNSSDHGRVSLAHVFENAQHAGYTVQPAAWDAFMDNFVDAADAYKTGGDTGLRARSGSGSTKLPLVSLADLNLAIGYGGSSGYGCPSTVISPFCRYLGTQGGSDFVTSGGGNDSEMMRQMTFVTDSYLPKALPSANAADDDYDLCDTGYQPFRAIDLRQEVVNCAMPMTYAAERPETMTRFTESLCGLGLAALWDYLDEDNVPISLAIPTTERVPMICAVQPMLNGSLTVTKNSGNLTGPAGAALASTGTTRPVERVDTYTLDPNAFSQAIMGGKIKALVAFPFHRDDAANDTFRIGGRVEIFFADRNMKFHTGNQSETVHFSNNPNLSNFAVQDGIFYFPLQEQQVGLPNVENIGSEADAVKEVTFELSPHGGQLAAWLAANPMYKVTWQWTQRPDPNYTGTGTPPWIPLDETDPSGSPSLSPAGTVCGIPPLRADGIVNQDYVNAASFQSLVMNGGGADVSLKVCVWLYVKNGDGKYVDLVPACMKDDDDLNNGQSFQFMGPDGNTIAGTPYPLLRFAGVDFTYNPKTLDTTLQNRPFDLGPTAVMCADPRWNWAPEHWFVMPGAFSAQGWLDNCQRGQDGRDRDIFMATSDQCYLQSVYELAFLPRLTNLENHGADMRRGDMEPPEDGRAAFAANFNDTRNKDFAWRTYRPFPLVSGQTADDFDGVGFKAEGSGFRVNPYSSNVSVLTAALANTPYNWMVAATNTTGDSAIVSENDRKAENFNRKYCFNMLGPSHAKFEWDDLKAIAENLKAELRSRSDGDWRAGFDALDWSGITNPDAFGGRELSGSTVDLYDVDRKFLYGFWKDSFAAKQQLFLVFVRAEPMMMGGGAVGQTPPQLGARAVALVWRDPTKTQEDVGGGQPRPHRTRVLFYRQFD